MLTALRYVIHHLERHRHVARSGQSPRHIAEHRPSGAHIHAMAGSVLISDTASAPASSTALDTATMLPARASADDQRLLVTALTARVHSAADAGSVPRLAPHKLHVGQEILSSSIGDRGVVEPHRHRRIVLNAAARDLLAITHGVQRLDLFHRFGKEAVYTRVLAGLRF